MSEAKLISPLLDGFTIGNTMSNHDGVQCCPAIKENTKEKYIIKTISIPASQVQLDALLLTGAYKDPADAMDYFKEVANGVIKEAETLSTLAKLEGYLAYEDWQIVPMEDGKLGYQVYLIGSYKRSLDRYMRRNGLTHLEAINLGLDLCAALAIARRAGLLYIDLKPTNIFISKGKEYRIGDLGFAELDSLKYTSLPAKYRSDYSAPEVQDALNTLNETVDTYAVGMILYQIYNNGILPKAPRDPGEAYPAAENADYEISEIIMKAIDPKVENRWKDPMEMGQALVSYMQRNSVNNTPIVPPLANLKPIASPKAPEKEEAPIYMDGIIEELPENEEASQPAVEENMPDVQPDSSSESTNLTDSAEHVPEAAVEPEIVPPEPAETLEEASSELPKTEDAPEELDEDETVDEEDDFDLEDDFSFLYETEPPKESGKLVFSEEPIPQSQNQPVKEHKHFGKHLIAIVAVLMVLAILACGGYLFYQNYYLLTIDSLAVDGSQNELTVYVDTRADHSLLTVTCTDTYGNHESKQVVNGEVVFSNLLPDSVYRIKLETSGFHQLVGKTSEIFTTDAMTSIVSFTGITGPEDGSVMLNFTVDGAEPDEWVVTYSAEGEEPLSQAFTGHDVTVKGLTVGKTYTFTLGTSSGAELLGETSMEFDASGLVMAKDLTVVSCKGGDMIVRWSQPDGGTVDTWNVRCYNDSGYEQFLETSDTEVTFSSIDTSAAYTVEVTADGMTQPNRTSITANPITITALKIDETDLSKISLSWDFEGAAPEGGWLLMYSMDNASTQSVVKCDKPNAVISPRVHGSSFKFIIQAANGTSIFSNIHNYDCPEAEPYEGQSLTADKVSAQTLVTPLNENWSFYNISAADLTDTFKVGDHISILLHANSKFYIRSEEISVLYVIRNSNDQVISKWISHATIDWNKLWAADDTTYGELDLPVAPDEAGSYSLDIYFNNKFLTTANFTVSE